MIIGGAANGWLQDAERTGDIFSLWSWAGPGSGQTFKCVIPDRRRYTVRPEGLAIIQVAGQRRILFVEDRDRATEYATRKAVHWPLSIVGNLQDL